MTARCQSTGVTKVFNQGRADEVTALSDVDLTVGAGEFVSLIGPSGCGKSTLLRLIADLIAADHRHGHGRRQARRRRPACDQDYGIAFQQAGLFEWRTVRAQRRAAAGAARLSPGRAPGPGRGDAGPGRAGRLRRALPGPALRRHAAAGRDRPGAGRAAAAAADGRAVRRARRDDPRAAAVRAARHLREDRHQHGLRHPLHLRGGVPVRPGRGHVAAAGPDHRRRSTSTCRPATRRPGSRRRTSTAITAVRQALRGRAA